MARQWAVFVVFALNGLVLGSWAPRSPALIEQAGVGPGAFSVALLAGSVGMLLAATASGRLLERFGARLVIAVSGLALFAALTLLGSAQSLPWLAAGLLCLGATSGVLDVGMNVAGVAVERAAGKPLMPLLHAGFSVGSLVGAGAAGLAASADWSPARQFVVAAACAAVVLLAVLRPLPGVARPVDTAAPASPATLRVLARRPVLWLLAVVALGSAIAEGASSDWSALLLVTEQGVDEGAAAAAYAGFSFAMALARLVGSWAQARFGAGRVLVVGSLAAGAGLLATALAGVPWVSYAGFALAGAGLSACFPLALGLAGEAGRRADGSGGEREVAFVTAIAYAGFLAGPPMIGGVAALTSLSVSFVVVGLVAVVIAPAAAAATRRLGAGAADRRTALR
ncbi:MFS transporter [Saccharomonospora piscinae]|uniref:MFS transporter n=1 Tax=Saccharomonospora piscinae TaxID=687388 RepID=UPI001105C5CB|nr:MFS transporter [Saccharomonospora piscinae]TLW91139.1 MFS transporter [Saccharomonospora piscinae]